MMDVDEGIRSPETVVAVPTYLTDGRRVWLGNPALEKLFARLSEAVA